MESTIVWRVEIAAVAGIFWNPFSLHQMKNSFIPSDIFCNDNPNLLIV
jgi:hypothetical protein